MRFQKLFGLRAEALLIEAIRTLLLLNGNQRNHRGVHPLLPANVKTVFRLLTEPLSTSHLLDPGKTCPYLEEPERFLGLTSSAAPPEIGSVCGVGITRTCCSAREICSRVSDAASFFFRSLI